MVVVSWEVKNFRHFWWCNSCGWWIAHIGTEQNSQSFSESVVIESDYREVSWLVVSWHQLDCLLDIHDFPENLLICVVYFESLFGLFYPSLHHQGRDGQRSSGLWGEDRTRLRPNPCFMNRMTKTKGITILLGSGAAPRPPPGRQKKEDYKPVSGGG